MASVVVVVANVVVVNFNLVLIAVTDHIIYFVVVNKCFSEASIGCCFCCCCYCECCYWSHYI